MVWSGVMPAPDVHRVAAAIWRIESPKLIAMLARLVRSVALAEELAQDAFVEALSNWSDAGIPDKPGAWLMTAARSRAFDALRHARRAERKQEQLVREVEAPASPSFDEAPDDVVGDDLLRLVFIACHPALSAEARVALTLRLLGGLTTRDRAALGARDDDRAADRVKRTPSRQNVRFSCHSPSLPPLTSFTTPNPRSVRRRASARTGPGRALAGAARGPGTGQRCCTSSPPGRLLARERTARPCCCLTKIEVSGIRC